MISYQCSFSALQRAENSSTTAQIAIEISAFPVSVLFSEPKIPQRCETQRRRRRGTVSVLFSEPKIPQPVVSLAHKFPSVSFSALQRAENSSTEAAKCYSRVLSVFQCSSASRKFLNYSRDVIDKHSLTVSVLFSEPKIPQLCAVGTFEQFYYPFQCSSASRKFLNREILKRYAPSSEFQCSSASRKFLNWCINNGDWLADASFSALQRAENSSTETTLLRKECERKFQCSSASRKFLNSLPALRAGRELMFQCSSASRKFLNACPIAQ